MRTKSPSAVTVVRPLLRRNLCVKLMAYIHGISVTDNKKTPSPMVKPSKTVLLSGPSGARTLDTLIKSQVLFQLS